MSTDLKVGAGREIITPSLGTALYGYLPRRNAESVNDDLTVTAVAFECNGKKALLMSATLCVIDRDLSLLICNKICEETGVPACNIIIAATHTHSGPMNSSTNRLVPVDSEYNNSILVPKAIKAAKDAAAGMKSAIAGIGTVRSDAGVNRRQINKDGSIRLGQNPWGCYDPVMTVIAFKSDDGTPIANIIHYGAHCTAAGRNAEITRDWPGPAIDRLEQQSGALTMFINGAEGDVGPRLSNGKTTGDISHVSEIGSKAAIDAVQAYRSIREYAKIEMNVIDDEIKLPYASLISKQEALAKFNSYPEDSENWDLVYRNHYKGIIDEYESGRELKTHLVYNQTIIQAGPVIFVPFPFEVFSEITLRLREYSPYQHTLSLSNAGGNYSYFPSQDQICRGGYEVNTFKMINVYTLADNADTSVINENLRIIQKMKSKQQP